jgi:hypothetical protein
LNSELSVLSETTMNTKYNSKQKLWKTDDTNEKTWTQMVSAIDEQSVATGEPSLKLPLQMLWWLADNSKEETTPPRSFYKNI